MLTLMQNTNSFNENEQNIMTELSNESNMQNSLR